MIFLTQGASHKLRLTTDAAGDIECSVHRVKKIAGTGGFQYNFVGEGDPLANVTTAATVDLAVGAASEEWAVEHMTLYNDHASQAVTCKVFEEDGTHTVTHAKVVLAAGEKLNFDAAGNWVHYDANMGPYVGTGPFATQAQMEGGTDNTVVVPPGRLHYHPGVAKFWVEFTGNSTSILASYNTTSITDGTTAATVTIATDFSSANWCCMATAEGTTNTVAAARLAWCYTIAAGSILVACCDAAATSAMQDPTRWHVLGFGDQ